MNSLVKETSKYIAEMGETGAGINAEDQIDMEKPNTFTNKWGAASVGHFEYLAVPL